MRTVRIKVFRFKELPEALQKQASIEESERLNIFLGQPRHTFKEYPHFNDHVLRHSAERLTRDKVEFGITKTGRLFEVPK